MKPGADPPTAPVRDVVVLTASLAGFAICLFLFVRPFLDPGLGIPGCGGGGCGGALASRWARVAGVPVAFPGALVYLAMMAAMLPPLWRLRLPVAGIIAGAGLWFTFVQAVLLKSFCPWCCALHSLGFLVFVLLLRKPAPSPRNAVLPWAAVGLLGTGLAQVYGPAPSTAVGELMVAAGADHVPSMPETNGRVVSFDGGRLGFDVSAHPLLGDPGARHVLVEVFDYLCPACVTMSGHLEALVAAHPREVAVLLLPVALERRCNPRVPPADEHPGSCEVAMLALATFRAAPERFPEFHLGLMADPSLETARRSAAAVPYETLRSHLADPSVATALESNIRTLGVLSRGSDKLPKLLVRDRRILHGLPADRAGFIEVMERELGISPGG